jgi:hypothetical protein
MVVGEVFAHIGYALAPKAEEFKMPTIFPVIAADDLTQRAFSRVEIPDAPRGPVKLDQWGNPIQNIYVRKEERKGGELQNTVIHTFPGVSQFWTQAG